MSAALQHETHGITPDNVKADDCISQKIERVDYKGCR